MKQLQTIQFSLPVSQETPINLPAVKKVEKFLPELDQKTKAFDRQNSQTTLSLMSLTMLNGQSPMRMMRQVMSEVEKRKLALAEAQVKHAELTQEIEELEGKTDPVSQAKLRHKQISLSTMESKVNGSFKDIATLIDQYNNLKEANNIDDWDETDYEASEKKHHIRRGFELMYRNLIEGHRAQTATIEYLQQYGVHPQVAIKEVVGYIQVTEQKIADGDIPHSNDLEQFLDDMSNKYLANVDKTAERMFGKANFTNTEYMLTVKEDVA